MAILADGYRIALNGLTGGRPWTNVFHFQLAGGDPPTVVEAAQIVADAWGTTVFDYTSNTTDLDSISYVDLRTLDGDSGTIPSAPTYTGGNAAAASSPQVAVLIKWATDGGRTTRNGRTYVPGVAEGSINAGGVLDNTQVVEFSDEANNFIEACQVGELILSVLHLVSPTEGEMRTVLSGTCDTRVATQRRRQRS